MGLSINWGNSAVSGTEYTIYVLQTNHQVFKAPTAFSIPANRLLQLYHTASDAVMEYSPNLSGSVSKITRDDSNSNYITLSQEGKHMLWGYGAGPDNMANYGKALFTNVVSYLISQ